MIVAGEPSGDSHAAALVQALQESLPGGSFKFFGATGPLMRAVGVESLVNSDELAILGLLEIGRALPKFVSAYKTLKKAALKRRPAAVILVDWPDFNFRLARTVHRNGLKTIYYIGPQLWAWRSHRLRNIKRDVDLVLTILPFERSWYTKRGVNHVEFVGHPLVGEVRARFGREEFCRLHSLDPAKPIIALLPGSRKKELQRILPSMLDAAALLQRERSDLQFVTAVAPSRAPEEALEILRDRKDALQLEKNLTVVHGETREALQAADAAAIASGTATLEGALLNTPMVIVYKESRVNWHVLGSLITAEHYGLVNLIAGERLVTELMQDDLNGVRLAAELNQLLDDTRNSALREQLRKVTLQLGEAGASTRAAGRILLALKEWSPGR